jgi:hypothetical protein
MRALSQWSELARDQLLLAMERAAHLMERVLARSAPSAGLELHAAASVAASTNVTTPA